MPDLLRQLKSITTFVADTEDIDSIKALKLIDVTTKSSLILQAANLLNTKN